MWFGRLTRWPLGRMCARAHFAPNLQLPLETSVVPQAELSRLELQSYLLKVLARRYIGRRLGRVHEGTRFASLTSSLPEELARHVGGVYYPPVSVWAASGVPFASWSLTLAAIRWAPGAIKAGHAPHVLRMSVSHASGWARGYGHRSVAVRIRHCAVRGWLSEIGGLSVVKAVAVHGAGRRVLRGWVVVHRAVATRPVR